MRRLKQLLNKWKEQRELKRLMDDLPYKLYRICERYRVEFLPGKTFTFEQLTLNYYNSDYRMRCIVSWGPHAFETCVYRMLIHPYTIADRANIEVSECHKGLEWLRTVDKLYNMVTQADLEDFTKRFSPMESAYNA